MMLQDRIARLCDLVPGMTRATAMVFIALWDARNRLASYDYLAERASGFSAHSMSDEALRTSVKHLRKMISAANLPLRIENCWSVGYRMVRLDPTWTWE